MEILVEVCKCFQISDKYVGQWIYHIIFRDTKVGGEEAEEEEEDQQSSLLLGLPSTMEPSGDFKRTGTIWTALAHIITGVIGAGVLSLAWSVAQLGWIAGPLLMIVFASVTIVSNNMLSDCYRYPDPHAPTRNRSYMEAVKLYLGDKLQTVSAVFVHESLYGCGIAYTITTASSIKAIQKSNCYHTEGHQASCTYGHTLYMLIFGAVQIFVSQIPDFHNMQWLSAIAAIMSFAYSSIGLGLGLAKVIENGSIKGSWSGVATSTVSAKLFLAFQALGDIAFAYPYSIILLEIQDTLKSPPPENYMMKKASLIAILVTTFFYLCCGCFGYAAFGDDTPGNILTGFGFFEPYWLVDFANACIVLHLVGGYQVFSQPVFAVAERWFSNKYPNSAFVNKFYSFKIPMFPRFQVNLFRLCFRTVYVISTTGIAMLFPYFNQVLGVLGALNFWPLAIYFPVEMYFVQKKIGIWTKKWIVLQTFSFVCFLVTVVGLIGSIEGLISAKLS
ncbi:LOW QUALITY PROTEIN: probable amino acid permease 7 [Argentina anserina]|uniref:LOW QUALITY PROTEIN: probable amino acid permease 7 n=1 Tax=Argentina anserina TaxID=57926 RepID=UPI00217673ED|nr:LOW QUALITY PROTEIN: probable amino acid permease 7 [Potentilla anserina]